MELGQGDGGRVTGLDHGAGLWLNEDTIQMFRELSGSLWFYSAEG